MDEDDVKVIEIAGVEQLWRIILDSNDEKLAASTIAFLVHVYLDVIPDLRAGNPNANSTSLR